jgi:hypothetical protein
LVHELDRLGIESRVVKLTKHVVAEGKWSNRWHLLDADLFKHGVIPRKDDGEIPALWEVQGNYFMDRFPPTMYVYTRDYKKYRDLPAKELAQIIEPHEAGFMSHFYQMNLGLPREYPPSRPENLVAKVKGKTALLSWFPSTDRDNDLAGYEVMVNNVSRGWNYDNPEYQNVPRDTSDTRHFTEVTSLELTDLEKKRYFWSVKAIDSHVKKEKRTYYFPSEEKSFLVK